MLIFNRLGRFGAVGLACAGSIFVASACGASDSSDATRTTSNGAPKAQDDQTSPSSAPIDGAGVSELERGLDEAGLGSKAEGLLYAMKADRYEIVGDELHLYLGDKTSAPQGTECMIATSVLSTGETVVIHRGETVTPCE